MNIEKRIIAIRPNKLNSMRDATDEEIYFVLKELLMRIEKLEDKNEY